MVKKYTFDVTITHTQFEVEVNCVNEDEAKICAKKKAMDMLLDGKFELLKGSIFLKDVEDTANDKSDLYSWKATSGHKGDENYEDESTQYFATQKEAYDDMRRAVLEKMKWNTEFREDFDEDDRVDYKVVFSQKRIVHTSYSGTYIYDVCKGDMSLYKDMEKGFAKVLSFAKTIAGRQEDSIDCKTLEQMRAIWTAFCWEFDLQVASQGYDLFMDQIVNVLNPILKKSYLSNRRNSDIYFSRLL